MMLLHKNNHNNYRWHHLIAAVDEETLIFKLIFLCKKNENKNKNKFSCSLLQVIRKVKWAFSKRQVENASPKRNTRSREIHFSAPAQFN
jgi:hypothetical protein